MPTYMFMYVQFVNAHVQVYDRWASPFSISIMHAHMKKKKKKPCTMYMPGAGFSLPKKFLLCPDPAGFNYEKLGVIPCPSGIVESRYPPNTGHEHGLCGGKGDDVFTNRMGERARAS